MYVSILEYVFVRLLFGAVRVVARMVELGALLAVWLLGTLLRLIGRPLLREVAHACGRLLGHARLARVRLADRGGLVGARRG